MAKKEKIKQIKSQVPLKTRIYNQRELFLMMIPAVLSVIIFSYGPMSGLYMAFVNYMPSNKGWFHDLFTAPFVGLEWFEYFWETDFLRVLRNTLSITILTFVISFPMPIILAILLNEVHHAKTKKFIQTASYLPHFISWVIAANMILTMLSGKGVINDVLMTLHIIDEPILFMQRGQNFKWVMAFSSMWKGMGYGAIIYLAAISGVDQEMYEAAEVDGANRIQRIWYLTIPAILPTISIQMILAVGGLLNTGFENILLMQNDGILAYSDVFDTYSFRYGLRNAMYSYGTAIGMFRSVMSFLLVIFANKVTKKLNGSAMF